MKKLFNNSYLVISLYLLFGFLIDIMTNLTINLSFSIGMILRGLLLLYLILGLFIKYPKKENYFILGILGIFSIVFVSLKFNFESISYIFKYNYVLILLLFIYNLYKSEDKKINRNIITLSLIFYSLCIIFAWITKTSLDTYGISKVGSKGWFNSANEISAIISIIVPYLIINLEKRINFIEIFAIAISLFASILIGTRLPIIAFLISLLYLLIKKFIRDIKRKKVNYVNILIFIAFIIVFVLKFKTTPMYKNLVVHIKYLKLNNPIDVFTNFKLFDHFIFNERLSFLVNINKIMVPAPIISKLFGLTNITKTVEMDLFDIFYRYGVIGFIVFIFVITYVIKKIKNRKKVNYLPITFIVISSFLSGHVILSPNVAIISVIVLANMLYEKERKKIFISSSTLNVGGVENALVTFIKKLNKDTNEITLYLEKKEGSLLKEIPKDVIIKEHKVFNSKTLNTLNRLKYLLTNFKEYDFAVCYKTESISSNFLARHASNNNAIYIHSDYTVLFKNDINNINKFLNKIKIDKFKKIIFVSNESKDNLISFYPRLMDKSIVINNFIDNDKIINGSIEKVKLTKPRGKKVFISIGKIEESSKNYTRMINSFKKVLNENNKFELWIIGSGPDEKFVKGLINKNNLEKYIIMLGEKTNPYPYLKMADYVIVTSNYEGFPVVYGEAITLEKPIITTIDVSDESITIPHNFGIITKKNETDVANTVLSVLNKSKVKMNKIDIDDVNNKKYELIEKMISK